MSDKEIRDAVQRDLWLYGNAYLYKDLSGEVRALDPQRLTIYRKDSSVEVTPVRKSRAKRFAMHITDPVMLVFGIVASIILASGLHSGGFFLNLGTWYLGSVLWFVLKELRNWARPAPETKGD